MRLVMTPEAAGVPDLVSLGRYNHTRAQPGLRDHRHPGAMEICYLVKGRQTYRLNGHDYRLRGGDVFCTFPGESHSTGGSPQEKGVLYWMELRLSPKRASLLGLPARQGGALRQGLLGLKARHFRGSLKMKADLDAMTELLCASRSPLRSCALANHAAAFLLEMVRCGSRPPAPVSAGSIRAALLEISRRLDEPMGIPELAQLAGLSVPRFHVRFKEETGLPPGEFILRAKMDEACRRLRGSDQPVTRIAFDLGFSTSQYFATVFKRFTGRSPREFRASPGAGMRSV